MGYVNKVQKSKVESHLNWMGGTSYDVENPILKLRLAASSCFFGEPQYYHKDKGDKRFHRAKPYHSKLCTLNTSQLNYLRDTLDAEDPKEWRKMTPAQMMESAIDAALDTNVEATLQEAVRLRQEDYIRTTPQVILVRAANHKSAKGTGLIRKYASSIISRADEPSVGLAYQLSTYGEKAPIPNALKKAWKDALEKFKDYHLAKYKMESRAVKTVDVVNLVHPKSESINKLVNGELTNTGNTWEAIISAEGSNKESWIKALDKMGHMALIRNCRNLLDKNVDPDLFTSKLISGAKTGKQLPFRYYSAYNQLKDCGKPQVLDAIEECLMLSVENIPKFSGKTMSLCDNSGSAWGTMTSSAGTMQIAKIANLTGILAGMASDEGHVGIFGDSLKTFVVRKRSSVFDQMEKADSLGKTIGGATENGIWLFWRDAINKKQHWDNVFIFSDMQAGYGGLYGTNPYEYAEYLWGENLKKSGSRSVSRYGGSRHIDVAKLINKYRSTVNPNVKVYLVQVAGYQDTILPEFYKNTYILGGWGDGLFRFAHAMSNLNMPSNTSQ